ncbi:hypothetical protein BDR03DRAFT_944191, partial [Suillus americanus]
MSFNFRIFFRPTRGRVLHFNLLVVVNILTDSGGREGQALHSHNFPWLFLLLSSTKFSTQRVPNRYLSTQRKGYSRKNL